MADDSSTLDRIVKAGWFLVEVPFFLPVDIATVWLRSSQRTRFIKRWVPTMSCRRYTFGGEARCSPARKYEHWKLFRYCVCRYLDTGSRNCHHPLYWKPEDK